MLAERRGFSLVNFGHALEQHLGPNDVLGENLRAVLIARCSALRKPVVVTSSARSALRTSNALAATVMPIICFPRSKTWMPGAQANSFIPSCSALCIGI